MKLLIQKETNLTKYIWENIEFINDKQTQADNIIFDDLWINNAEIIEIDSKPNDWVWNKYLYINWEFVLNENYIEEEL